MGKRAGKEAVVLSLLEKKTENYIAIRIPGKDADSVEKDVRMRLAFWGRLVYYNTSYILYQSRYALRYLLKLYQPGT